MVFQYADAWLLESIKFSEQSDQGATLKDVVMAADYINHAIMTYQEFVSGAGKLKSIGLITEENKCLRTTEKFNEWWTANYGKKKRLVLLKIMVDIEKYLNKTYGAMEDTPVGISTEFDEADFTRSVKEYSEEVSKIVAKLNSGKR